MTQMDEHDFLSFLFAQNIDNDILSYVCDGTPAISPSENFKAWPHFQ